MDMRVWKMLLKKTKTMWNALERQSPWPPGPGSQTTTAVL
jgi:hypothetical protein